MALVHCEGKDTSAEVLGNIGWSWLSQRLPFSHRDLAYLKNPQAPVLEYLRPIKQQVRMQPSTSAVRLSRKCEIWPPLNTSFNRTLPNEGKRLQLHPILSRHKFLHIRKPTQAMDQPHLSRGADTRSRKTRTSKLWNGDYKQKFRQN